MATLTAQILIGSPHPNDDGISPTHYLFLSENSRPAWVLVRQNVFPMNPRNRRPFRKITWIPTLEHMLEDALLMTAVHLLNHEELTQTAKGFCREIDAARVELYPALSAPQRDELYGKCKAISEWPKLVISVFRGSTIREQLPVLKEYKMDVEVCRPCFTRLYSAWEDETSVEGSLE